jgi:hypothetical protein
MGIADSFGAGVNAIGGIYRNQMLRDQLQDYPQLVDAQLQQAQNTAGLSGVQLQYAPQTQQADIASKMAYANLAPYQAYAAITNNPLMWYALQNGLIKLPNLNNGTGNTGNTVSGNQATGNANMPALSSTDGGYTVQPATGMAAPNYPMLPGQTGVNPQQLNAGPNAGLGAPLPGTTGTGDFNSTLNALANSQLNRMLLGAGKDPRMGTNRSGAGGTYTNPMTGQQISTDTTKNTTLDQQTSASIQRVQPLLTQLSDNLAPFQTIEGEAGLKVGQLLNYTGYGNASAPADYAKGKQALALAPEGLMRAWGLNITDDSKKTMQEAVEPIFGETPVQYQARIVNTLKQLQDIQNQAEGRLANGMVVGNKNANQQASPKYSDDDIAFTAKKYNLTIDQVKQKLGVQ